MTRRPVVRVWPLCAFAALAMGCEGSSPEAAAPAVNTSSMAASAPTEGSPGAGVVGGALGGAIGGPSNQTVSRMTPINLPETTGTARQNSIIRLEVTEAGFFPAGRALSKGRRHYTVSLRGTSRSDGGQLLGGSKGDDVVVDAQQFVFAQNERGCLSKPEFDVAGVPNQFQSSITFPAGKATEGRLTFLLPEDTQRVRVLIAPAGSDGLAVPAGADFTPSWPAPIHTITDGTTLRVLVLPRAATPPTLPAPGRGKEHVVLDVVVQNLSKEQGIEFQPSQQLRLMNAGDEFIEASEVTERLGCRMDDGESIPPGQVRRLMAVYEMPVGGAHRLHYRGFEKEETIVAIR